MVGMGALSHKQTGEIVRYYHAMFMRTLKKKLMKIEGDHVIGDYSKGASLLGLTDKQLLKYLKPLCSSKSRSPYSVLPCLTAEARPKRLLRKPGSRHPALDPEGEPGGHISLHRKNTVIAMRPGPKTKNMISPVQVKLRISKKTRNTMRYDSMALIRKRVKEGSNQYLNELFQSKQRDTSKLWDELGKWNAPEALESFQQNFSTYSWSWTGCRNLLEIEDLSQKLFLPFHTQMSSPSPSTASHSRPLNPARSTDQVEEIRQVD
ncbi:uncharacterized protein LOC121301762 [Polyodon spathula]|uniref:uncharacterized protein LOC121301762 n=1 Tax=Polyodon spathula TaxID=7913 RepID=UPI001B7F346D|nr:uncharacterized protein LOC121301762 [Polyodon spathula]